MSVRTARKRSDWILAVSQRSFLGTVSFNTPGHETNHPEGPVIAPWNMG
jgi:hypothetical protein